MTDAARPARRVAALGLFVFLALGLGALLRSPGARSNALPARFEPQRAPGDAGPAAPAAMEESSEAAAAGAAGPIESRLPLPSASAIGPRHRIQVVDAAGAPLAGSFVRPRYEVSLDAAVVGGETKGTRRADADGWIDVPLWSGPELVESAELDLVLTAQVGRDSLRGTLDDRRLREPSGQRYPGVVLAGLGTLVAGRVTESCGRPLDRALVLAWWEDPELDLGRSAAPERPADFSLVTLKGGRFEFRGQREGRLLLSAARSGWPRVALRRVAVPTTDLELMAHREEGLRGSLSLPPEVGDLAVELTASPRLEGEALERYRLLSDWREVSHFEVGHGTCFELPSPSGPVELRLYGRFPLWSGDVPEGSTVDVPAAALAPELVPLRLRVFDGAEELQHVSLEGATFKGAWGLDLEHERRFALPPEAFPLTVLGPDGRMARVELEGGYERRVELDPALALWLELDLPPAALDLPLRVRLEPAGEAAGGAGATEFFVKEARSLLTVPEPGDYRATLLLPAVGAAPEVSGRVQGLGADSIRYRRLDVHAFDLGVLELEARGGEPPVVRRSVFGDRLPDLRALELGENPWGEDPGRRRGWLAPRGAGAR